MADKKNPKKTDNQSTKQLDTKKTKTEKKAPKLDKNGNPKPKWYKSTWFKALLIIFLVCVIIGSIAVGAFMMYVFSTMENDDELLNLDNVKMAFTTMIYAGDKDDEDKELLISLSRENNRIWVDYENIPANMVNAVIAIEDERFWTHQGVDWKRTAAGLINEIIPIFSTRQGGSTITQQVVRNITDDRSVNALEGYVRKAREIFRALNLEKTYEKEDILECYLNIFHLANGTDGVQAAAHLYFGKDVKDLTLAECACIAGITQSPVRYDPFTNPENNRERQLRILGNMLEQELITQEEYDAAVAQEMVFNTEEYEAHRGQITSYYEDAVINAVLDDLMEQYEYTKEEAYDMLYTGGLRIYTKQDPKVQAAMEKIYANPDYFIKVRGEKQPESAAVVIDMQGNVVGLVGGRGEKKESLGLNRATDTTRQNGSTMKPIGSYGPAIERDLVTWSTVIEDSPVKKIGGKDWPKNYYGAYRGNMTVQEALAKSVNTVAVKTGQLVTPQAAYNHLTSNLGITTLVKERDGRSDIDLSPMFLGALTDGISVLELSAAYVPFGNGGTYYEPKLYTLVEDQFGNVILDNTEVVSKRAYSEETAFVMNKMLQTVLQSGGTAYSYRYGSMPLAGKTGTTQDANDILFVGMNPYYSCAVWWGFDEPATLSETGYQPAATWKRIMSTISSGLSYKDFPKTSNAVQKEYCTVTGLLKSEACEEGKMGWYKKSNIPEECTECADKKAQEEADKNKPTLDDVISGILGGGGNSSQGGNTSQGGTTNPGGTTPGGTTNPGGTTPGAGEGSGDTGSQNLDPAA